MNRIFFVAIVCLLLQACAGEAVKEQEHAATTVDTIVNKVQANRIEKAGWLLGKWKSNKPQGSKEASITDTMITFENPEHDFPQRIVYKRLSDRTMLAYIEGRVNGKYQKVEFPFMLIL